jgi:UDP:flavonoid glycosyltransferase YjiC (YdhE family)
VRGRPWVPQADVLTDAAAVVCHGGSGTVLGTVAAGVPLVVAPMFADHAANARLVEAAGAGVTVGRADAGSMADAVTAVLAEPGYRAAAGRLAAGMRSAPSVDELLDDLVHARQSTEVSRPV